MDAQHSPTQISIAFDAQIREMNRYDSLEEPEPARPIRKQPSARTTSATKNARHAEEVSNQMNTLFRWRRLSLS